MDGQNSLLFGSLAKVPYQSQYLHNPIIQNKVEEFKLLFQERKIELAFGEIPKQIKQIKELAINEVFAKEINSLDENGKIVLEKLLTYMEKKYNALAIKTAKRVILEEEV